MVQRNGIDKGLADTGADVGILFPKSWNPDWPWERSQLPPYLNKLSLPFPLVGGGPKRV